MRLVAVLVEERPDGFDGGGSESRAAPGAHLAVGLGHCSSPLVTAISAPRKHRRWTGVNAGPGHEYEALPILWPQMGQMVRVERLQRPSLRVTTVPPGG